jgi:2-keto-4-pentenoate hydratase
MEDASLEFTEGALVALAEKALNVPGTLSFGHLLTTGRICATLQPE